MNKTAVKNYAVEARKKWMQQVAQQAAFYGCTEKGSLDEAEITKQLADKGVFLTADEKSARSNLVNEIKKKGYQNAIEEVAYTWFNRLIAIRFMEVNGYLPSGIRVLSSIDAGRIEPDCVREYARLDFLNQDTATKFAAGSDEKLYRYILVQQCNALGKIMPKMFTHIGGIAALLLPERLYIKDGLAYDLTHSITEEDFGEQVEIIGWIYQYYISEKKDEVFAALKKNVKITRENIPAATQLFTPDWIVKYMVENSLGRLWLEHCPPSMAHGNAEDALRELWAYYIEEADQEPEVEQKLKELRNSYTLENPTQIKIIDPCMGSGHILVYAFDVLYQIYVGQGYAERDIPDLILENNIYGLDIDERACQLAYFALMMKARSYNRRFFQREDVTQPQVYSPQGYEDGMEYGSLIKVDVLEEKPQEKEVSTLFDTSYETELNTWHFRRLLHQKYDVVVTNPPYMSSGGMASSLLQYVKKHYNDGRNDLYTVFVLKCQDMCHINGFVSMITQLGWMSLTRSAQLRYKTYTETFVVNMLHLGSHLFEDLSGEVVKSCSFVLRKSSLPSYQAIYYKVDGLSSAKEKEEAILNKQFLYQASIDETNKIEGAPLSYWLPRTMLPLFHSATLNKRFICRAGMQTGDNEQFLRFWYEPSSATIDHFSPNTKWFGYNKGGGQRKWFGNTDLIVNWHNNGEDIKSFKKRRLELGEIEKKNSECWNSEFYFTEGVTWSSISSGPPMFRYTDNKTIFDIKGPTCFAKAGTSHEELLQILGFLNTPIISRLLDVLSPTLDCNPGTVSRLPYISVAENQTITNLVKRCIAISRADWDSFETSWDFQTHPLATWQEYGTTQHPDEYGNTISEAFQSWMAQTIRQFETLRMNEEELNRTFIDIYGLQEELTPEVEDKDVTVRRADLGREIRSFISYAVGCMFGRYSLDVPGLAYAGGDWDGSKYQSYIPENDNILPITDADYFEDDIVMRFVDFVKVVYGEDTLAENLEFIVRALYPNGNGTAREMIRRYFQNDFFKDHCKTYQKRPIYWLFDSGKENGFKALIYLHHYDKYTVARVRTEYLHPLQRKYEAEIERMNKLADLPETSARDKAEFKKQTEKISKQIAECRAYDQIISHMAAQTIELDLDDGVKTNYEKFQGVEVPRDDGKGAVKMDLLGRI